MSRTTEIVKQYTTPDGVTVTQYAEKPTKKVRWMRGEHYCGIIQRTDDFTGGSMVHFSRKPGKY